MLLVVLMIYKAIFDKRGLIEKRIGVLTKCTHGDGLVCQDYSWTFCSGHFHDERTALQLRPPDPRRRLN